MTWFTPPCRPPVVARMSSSREDLSTLIRLLVFFLTVLPVFPPPKTLRTGSGFFLYFSLFPFLGVDWAIVFCRPPDFTRSQHYGPTLVSPPTFLASRGWSPRYSPTTSPPSHPSGRIWFRPALVAFSFVSAQDSLRPPLLTAFPPPLAENAGRYSTSCRAPDDYRLPIVRTD